MAAVQAGEREKLGELWGLVEKLIRWWANRLIGKLPPCVSFDDLYQCGFPALVSAVDTYDITNGGSFSGWLAYYYKSEIATYSMYRTKRQRKDPLNHAQSLDAPIGEEDGQTLADVIPDPLDPYEEAEERIFKQQLHDALDKALASLTLEQERVMRQRYYNEQSLRETGETIGISTERIRQIECEAFRNLRRPKIARELREYIEQRTPFYMRVSNGRFMSTGTSAVEEIVLLRERIASRREMETQSETNA